MQRNDNGFQAETVADSNDVKALFIIQAAKVLYRLILIDFNSQDLDIDVKFAADWDCESSVSGGVETYLIFNLTREKQVVENSGMVQDTDQMSWVVAL